MVHYVLCMNCYNHYTRVYLMKYTSDFLTIYNNFRDLAIAQHSVIIKCFWWDLGGGGYTFNDFMQLLPIDGTIHQTSCIDAERKHRYLVEIAHSLLLSFMVPRAFLGKRLLTVAYMIYWIPTLHNLRMYSLKRYMLTIYDCKLHNHICNVVFKL